MNEENFGFASPANIVKQLNSAMSFVPTAKQLSNIVGQVAIPTNMTKQLSGIVGQVALPTNMAKQISSFKSVTKYLLPISKILTGIDITTQNILNQQISDYQRTGWLIFDIVNFEISDEYFDIQEKSGHEEEFDIDDFGLWVVKNRKLNDITKEIEQLGLVSGTEYLPKMVKILKYDNQAYKILFQYVFSLVDATFLYQRNRFENSIEKLKNYNDRETVKNYYHAVELNASLLEADKFITGQKSIATVGFYKSLYNPQKNSFRNSLMHGSIKYKDLTETKFYQLLALLYQLTVNDEIYQFIK